MDVILVLWRVAEHSANRENEWNCTRQKYSDSDIETQELIESYNGS